MYIETIDLEEGKYYWKKSKDIQDDEWTISRVKRESGNLCIESRLWIPQALDRFRFFGPIDSPELVL